MKELDRYFSRSRLSYNNSFLSLHSSSIASPSLSSCQDRCEACCRPERISENRQEGLVESGSIVCGQEGASEPAGEGAAVYQDGDGARADQGGPAWVGRDKQGSTTLRCTQYIWLYREGTVHTWYMQPGPWPLPHPLPIAWQSRVASHGASGRARRR